MEAQLNHSPDLVEQARSGCDVHVFLRPDTAIAERRTQDHYIEVLHLPHLVCVEQALWASQRKLVTLPKGSGGLFQTSYFSYYSGADLFANTVHPPLETEGPTTPGISQIMSSGRYAELKWITKGGYEPVFDSETAAETDAYVEAIRNGARFKALLEMDERHFQLHPVIYPFFHPDENRVDVQTELQFFPDYMRYPKPKLRDLLQQYGRDYSDCRNPETKKLNLALKTPLFSSFYRIGGDASAQRLYDLESDRRVQLRRMLLFASVAT